MILTDAVSKAKSLLNNAITRTIKVYDASKTKIIVSGLVLDGVTKVTLTQDKVGDIVNGVNENDLGFYESWETPTLEISLLPTAKAIDSLKLLYKAQTKLKGFVKIVVIENGVMIDSLSGYLTSLPSYTLEKEVDDRVFTFTVKRSEIINNITESTTTVTETVVST